MRNNLEHIKYIGGEIELQEKIPGTPNTDTLANYYLYSTGRTALTNILKTINPQYPVLLPSFLCESIIQPFKSIGLAYNFYKIDSGLRIDHDFLIDRIKGSKYSAILFINYFGISSNLDISVIKRIDNDILFIEDCTHSTFIPNELKGLGNIGDIVFGSLRKTLPIGDGAYVQKSAWINSHNVKQINTRFSELKNYGKTLRRIYLRNRHLTELENIYLYMLATAEEELSLEIPNTRISETSFSILEQLNFEEIYISRRENYIYLYNRMINDHKISGIGYPLQSIGDMEMPFMLPFYVLNGERNKIREELRGKGIFTAVIWSKPDEVDPRIFEESYELSTKILCFPIDQRYSKKDMSYLFEKFKQTVIDG